VRRDAEAVRRRSGQRSPVSRRRSLLRRRVSRDRPHLSERRLRRRGLRRRSRLPPRHVRSTRGGTNGYPSPGNAHDVGQSTRNRPGADWSGANRSSAYESTANESSHEQPTDRPCTGDANAIRAVEADRAHDARVDRDSSSNANGSPATGRTGNPREHGQRLCDRLGSSLGPVPVPLPVDPGGPLPVEAQVAEQVRPELTSTYREAPRAKTRGHQGVAPLGPFSRIGRAHRKESWQLLPLLRYPGSLHL